MKSFQKYTLLLLVATSMLFASPAMAATHTAYHAEGECRDQHPVCRDQTAVHRALYH